MPILIITRPDPAAARFQSRVTAALGDKIETIVSPAMRIEPVDVGPLKTPDHVIFTSSNGVAAAQRIGLAKTPLAWCVGNRTADLADRLGFQVRAKARDAADLIGVIQESAPQGPMLHLAGTHHRGDIVETLRIGGTDASRVIAYDQPLLAPTKALVEALKGSTSLIVPLFSARSATILRGQDLVAPLHLILISEDVAKSVQDIEYASATIAPSKDEEGMIAATCQCIRSLAKKAH